MKKAIKIPKIKHKFNVKEEPKEKMDGWMGMNEKAAKAEHFGKIKLKKNDVLVKKTLPSLIKKRTIRHEEVEDELMRKGKKYKAAHKVALKAEKKVKK